VPARGGSGRDAILDTASQLFYEQGFHSVGVDLIVASAGVAKTTMYRHFPSKDDLIVAYLEAADKRFWDWFEASLDPHAAPAERLAGLFDSLARLVTSPACRGCAFQATASEFPDLTSAGHATALGHKKAVRARLRELAAEAGAADAKALGDALLLLMDGAFCAARMYGRRNPGAGVAVVARSLITAEVAERKERAERAASPRRTTRSSR
jgi:AcrR family transcriptional regulator